MHTYEKRMIRYSILSNLYSLFSKNRSMLRPHILHRWRLFSTKNSNNESCMFVYFCIAQQNNNAETYHVA